MSKEDMVKEAVEEAKAKAAAEQTEADEAADEPKAEESAASQENEKEPDEADVKGFQAYMKRYRAGLAAERAAVEAVRG